MKKEVSAQALTSFFLPNVHIMLAAAVHSRRVDGLW